MAIVGWPKRTSRTTLDDEPEGFPSPPVGAAALAAEKKALDCGHTVLEYNGWFTLPPWATQAQQHQALVEPPGAVSLTFGGGGQVTTFCIKATSVAWHKKKREP